MNWKYHVCNTQDPELRLLYIPVPWAERFCISNKRLEATHIIDPYFLLLPACPLSAFSPSARFFTLFECLISVLLSFYVMICRTCRPPIFLSTAYFFLRSTTTCLPSSLVIRRKEKSRIPSCTSSLPASVEGTGLPFASSINVTTKGDSL
jgi:hypothetical protein